MDRGGLDSILDTLEAVNRELNLLNARVNAVERGGGATEPGGTEGGKGARPPGAPILWSKVADEDRAGLWEQFVDWVLWVADTYELTAEQLPRECWWEHGSAVEELTALWTAHQSAYLIEEDSGSAPYLWQDAMVRFVERLNRNWLSSCTNGFHEPKSRTPFRNDDAYRTKVMAAVGGGPVAPSAPPPAAAP